MKPLVKLNATSLGGRNRLMMLDCSVKTRMKSFLETVNGQKKMTFIEPTICHVSDRGNKQQPAEVETWVIALNGWMTSLELARVDRTWEDQMPGDE